MVSFGAVWPKIALIWLQSVFLNWWWETHTHTKIRKYKTTVVIGSIDENVPSLYQVEGILQQHQMQNH